VHIGLWLHRKRELLRAHAFVLAGASGMNERADVLRFIARQGARMAGLDRADDTEVRFRGLTYVVDESGELLTLVELYRDAYYSREPGFLPAPGTTVVDIGANVGVFALHHATAGADVLAVEPNIAAFRRLSRAIAVNGLEQRVCAVNAAVGAASGYGRLQLPDGHTILGRVVPIASDGERRPDDIRILGLDELVRRHGIERIDLLKVDVEGAETDVFRGAGGAMPNVRRVIFEWHSPALLAEVRGILGDAGLREVIAFPVGGPVGMLYAEREDQT
jgi:FkbM family methyltransferase